MKKNCAHVYMDSVVRCVIFYQSNELSYRDLKSLSVINFVRYVFCARGVSCRQQNRKLSEINSWNTIVWTFPLPKNFWQIWFQSFRWKWHVFAAIVEAAIKSMLYIFFCFADHRTRIASTLGFRKFRSW